MMTDPTTTPETTELRTAQTLTRANLAIAALASKDASRLSLGSLYVTPTATVATDGHCMGIVDVDPSQRPNDGSEIKSFLVSADDVVTMAKAMPRKGDAALSINVAETNANGHVAATVDRLGAMPQAFSPRKVDLAFPAYEQVIPSADEAFSVCFNADLLAKVLKVASTCMTGKRMPGVKLTFFKDTDGQPDPLTPVKITGTTDDGQALTFLVMPCRL